MTIFCAPKTARKELWDGPTAGLNGAAEVFGADYVSGLVRNNIMVSNNF
jgi:hypothetical protein